MHALRFFSRCFILLASIMLTLPAHAGQPGLAAVVTDCSEAGLRAAIAAGGEITFSCGGPATITVSQEIEVRNNVTLDGAGTITLRGGGGRLFFHRTFDTTPSILTLKNLSITSGRAVGAGTAANGGAIRSINNSSDGRSFPQQLILENVVFNDNDVELTSFNGDAYDFGGGAIFSQGGIVVVKGCTFSGNDAKNAAGGAIHILQSELSIENSSFTSNSAIGNEPQNSLGGAIYIDGLSVTNANAALTITGSNFRDNRTYNSGGAIHFNAYRSSNRLVIERSSFIDNTVEGGTRAQGGAIGGGGTGEAPQITIATSLFQGNNVRKSASPFDGSGGALAFPQPAAISIENSTFYRNRAEGSSFNANGGALYVVNNPTPLRIASSTFAENFAGWVGGAVSHDKNRGGIVKNSIFFNNTAANGPNDWNIQQHCSAEMTEEGVNLQFPARLTGANFFNDATCFAGKSAPEQKNLPAFRDPKPGPLADNGGPTQTMALAPDSPALDAGSDCPATDQRGTARPQGQGCDLGAYELILRLSVTPALITAGAAELTITVSGSSFTAASAILWNGSPLATEFVNATTLRARVVSNLLVAGTVTISVSGSNLPAAQLEVAADISRRYLPLVRRP